MQSGSILGLLIALVCVTNVLANTIPPAEMKTCATSCSGKRSVAAYEAGKRYTYGFSNTHWVNIANATESVAGLVTSGKAHVEAGKNCEMVLLLTDVSMREIMNTTGKDSQVKEFEMAKTLLEKNPLSFAFDNGRVTGVCANPDDSMFAVNVKRAILSQLQISMDNIDMPVYKAETDVSGECLTEFKPNRASDSANVKIIKSKALIGCNKKHSFFTDATSMPFRSPSELREMILMDADHECVVDQEAAGYLKSSSCKENHFFNPISASKESVAFHITQSMIFDKIIDSINTKTVVGPQSSLILEVTRTGASSMPMKMKTGDAMDTKLTANLEALCTAAKKGSMDGVPFQFISLIRLMRQMNVEALTTLHDKMSVAEKTTCKDALKPFSKFFHDALPMVRTDASVKFMTSEMKEMPHGDTSKYWGLSMALIRDPTPAMIESVAQLAKPGSNLQLVLTTMVAKYCTNDPKCGSVKEVADVKKTLLDTIRTNKCNFTSDEETNNAVLYIHALGNMGAALTSGEDTDLLLECATSGSTTELRVSALDALRRVDCSDRNAKIIPYLRDTFLNERLTAEIRIKAYLIAMQCPRPAFQLLIADPMKDDKGVQNKQVGSFVLSHLANMLASADQFDFEKRDLIRQWGKIKKLMKFNLDARSYSRNYHQYSYNRRFKAATRVEANLIFAEDSYIPRSAMFNITLDVFGRRMNIFEFDMRMRGMEKIADTAFASFISAAEGDNSSAKKRRRRRQAEAKASTLPYSADDLSKYDKQVNGWIKKSSEPTLSVGARIFGHDVYHTGNFNPVNSMPNYLKNPVDMNSLGSIFSGDGINTDYTNSAVLADAVVVTSTVTGIPIELKLDLTSAVKMKFSARFGENAVLEATPSAALRLQGEFSLNAHCTQVGARLTMDALMERSQNLTVELPTPTNGNKMRLISAPVDYDQKFISLKTNMAIFTSQGEIQQKGSGKRLTKKTCTSEAFKTKIDAEICLEYDVPRANKSAGDPGYRFAGPMKFEIAMSKHKGLNIEYTRVKSDKLRHFRFALGNSVNSERFLFEMRRDRAEDKSEKHLLKINGLGTTFELTGDRTARGKMSGQFKKDGQVEATLTGSMHYIPNNDHFNLKWKDGKDALVAKMDFSKKSAGVMRARHMDLQFTKWFPFKIKTSRKIRVGPNGNDRVSMMLTLGKTTPYTLDIKLSKMSTNISSQFIWKKANDVIMQVRKQFELDTNKANSQQDGDISGTKHSLRGMVEVEMPMEKKTYYCDMSTSMFVGYSSNSKMALEHNFKMSRSKAAGDTLKGKWFMVVHQASKKTIAAIGGRAKWPAKNISMRHEARAEYWEMKKGDSSFSKVNMLLHFQPTPERTRCISIFQDAMDKKGEKIHQVASLVYPGTNWTLAATVTKGKKHLLRIMKNNTDLYIVDSDYKMTMEKLKMDSIVKQGTGETLATSKTELNWKKNNKNYLPITFEHKAKSPDGKSVYADLMTRMNLDYKTSNPDKTKVNLEVMAFMPIVTETKYEYLLNSEMSKKKSVTEIEHEHYFQMTKDKQIRRYGRTVKGKMMIEGYQIEVTSKSKIYLGVEPQDYTTSKAELIMKQRQFIASYKYKSPSGNKVEVKITSDRSKLGELTAESKLNLFFGNGSNYNMFFEDMFFYKNKAGQKGEKVPRVGALMEYKLKQAARENSPKEELTWKFEFSVTRYEGKAKSNIESLLNMSEGIGSYLGCRQLGFQYESNLKEKIYKSTTNLTFQSLVSETPSKITIETKAQFDQQKPMSLNIDFNTNLDNLKRKNASLTFELDLQEMSFMSKGECGPSWYKTMLDFNLADAKNPHKLKLNFSSSFSVVQSIAGLATLKIDSNSYKLQLTYLRNGDKSFNTTVLITKKMTPQDTELGFSGNYESNLGMPNGGFRISVFRKTKPDSIAYGLESSLKYDINYGNISLTASSLNDEKKRSISYAAKFSSEAYPDYGTATKGNLDLFNGVPLTANHVMTFNKREYVAITFSMLKKLNFSIAINVDPEFVLDFSANGQVSSSEIDVDLAFTMTPFVKKVSQKIVFFYCTPCKVTTKEINGKNAVLAVELTTTTEYDSFKKLSVSLMLTEETKIFGNIELNSGLYVLAPTSIVIDKFSMDKDNYKGRLTVGGTQVFALLLKKNYKGMTDMDVELTFTGEKDTVFKSAIFKMVVKGLTNSLELKVDELVNVMISSTPDGESGFSGSLDVKFKGTQIVLFQLGMKHKADWSDWRNSKYTMKLSYPGETEGTTNDISFDHQLDSMASKRVEDAQKIVGVTTINYFGTTIQGDYLRDGFYKQPLLQLTIKKNTEKLAEFLANLENNNNPNKRQFLITLQGIWELNITRVDTADEIVMDLVHTVAAYADANVKTQLTYLKSSPNTITFRIKASNYQLNVKTNIAGIGINIYNRVNGDQKNDIFPVGKDSLYYVTINDDRFVEFGRLERYVATISHRVVSNSKNDLTATLGYTNTMEDQHKVFVVLTGLTGPVHANVTADQTSKLRIGYIVKVENLQIYSRMSCVNVFTGNGGLCHLTHDNVFRQFVLLANVMPENTTYTLAFNRRKQEEFTVAMVNSQFLILTPFRKIVTTWDTSKPISEKPWMVMQTSTRIAGGLPEQTNRTLEISPGAKPNNYLLKFTSTELKRPFEMSVVFDYTNIKDFNIESEARFPGEKKPFHRFQVTRSNELKSASIMMGIGDKFLRYTLRRQNAVKYYNDKQYFLDINSSKGNRTCTFKMVPGRQYILMCEDRFNLEWSVVRSVNAFECVTKISHKDLDFRYERVTRRQYNPRAFYTKISTDIGDVVLDARQTGKRGGILEFYRLTTDSQRLLDLSHKFNIENRVMTHNVYFSPNIVADYKKVLGKFFDTERISQKLTVLSGLPLARVTAYATAAQEAFLATEVGAAMAKTINRIIDHYGTILPNRVVEGFNDDEFYLKTIYSALPPMGDYMTKAGEYLSSMSDNVTVVIKKSMSTCYEMIAKTFEWIMSFITDEKLQSLVDSFTNFFKTLYDLVSNYMWNRAKDAMKNSTSQSLLQYLYTVRGDQTWMEMLTRNYREYMTYAIDQYRAMRKDLAEGDYKFFAEQMKLSIDRWQQVKASLKAFRAAIKDLRAWIREYRMERLTGGSRSRKEIIAVLKQYLNRNYTGALLRFYKPENYDFQVNTTQGTIFLKYYINPITYSTMKWRKMAMEYYNTNSMAQARKMYFAASYRNMMKKFGVKPSYSKPPFSRYAWGIGWNKIISYDGMSLTGARKCSFIATRNFVTKDFSVFVNVGAMDNLVVVSGTASYAIKMNGNVTRLEAGKTSPRMGLFEISTSPKVSTIIYNKGQARVDVFPRDSNYRVEVTGGWHGQMAGALGTNDFNNVNDDLKPCGCRRNRETTTSARAWRLDDKDECNEPEILKIGDAQLCKKAFQIMKSCQILVDSTPFKDVCMKASDSCMAIRAYQYECRQKGNHISLPKTICARKKSKQI